MEAIDDLACQGSYAQASRSISIMGELVLANLGRRLALCELIGKSPDTRREILKVGRNKEAKIPPDKIIYRTGLNIASSDEIFSFSYKCVQIASSLNISEAWELLLDEERILTAKEIADSCIDHHGYPEYIVAVYLAINSDSIYFEQENHGFRARSSAQVKEILIGRERLAKIERDETDLLTSLEKGLVPESFTQHQMESLNHIREFAIHGDEYRRSVRAQELLKRSTTGNASQLQRHSFEILVKAGILVEDEPLEIERAGISTAFSKPVMEEVKNSIHQNDLMMNLTAVPTFTIDDDGTLDRDDAFSLENGSLWIHVTDMTELVSEDGEIDKEASNRMATLYMPDDVIPMLPPELSEELGSLKPNSVRPCLSLKLDKESDGSISGWSFHRTIVKSDKAISYEEADRILSNPEHCLYQLLAEVLSLTTYSRDERFRKGALTLNRTEMKVKTNSAGTVEVKVSTRDSASRTMIAELMILYNRLVAEYCHANGLPASYRLQAPPRAEFPDSLPDGPLGWYIASTLLRGATLSTIPGTHSSLGVEKYTQASSPIRRYTDLYLQRQLIHFIETGQRKYSESEMTSVGGRGDLQVRELARIEAQRTRYWFLKYLRNRYLETDNSSILKAIALENGGERQDMFELFSYPFRARCTIPESVNPGELINVRLTGIDLWHRSAQFTYVNIV